MTETLPPPPPPPGAYAVPPPQPAPAQLSSGCPKWGLVGCGCLTVLVVLFAVAITTVVFGAIKHSAPYEESKRQAMADQRVIDALGTPMEPSFIVMGSVKIDNGRGDADINYTLSGPKDKGKVHVVATRVSDAWSYTEMTVKPEKGAIIDLLH